VALNSNDPLYTEFRDLNIEVLGGQLQDRYAGPAHNTAVSHPSSLIWSVASWNGINSLLTHPHGAPSPVRRAKEIKAIYASFKTDRDASIEKIHHFVKSIPQLTQKYRGLNLYINIAELLKPTTDSVRFRHQWQVRPHVLRSNQSADLPSRRLHLPRSVSASKPSTGRSCMSALVSCGLRWSGRWWRATRSTTTSRI
jgi:hypothetical protein